MFIPLIETNHLWHSTMASGFAAYLLLTTYLLFAEYEESGRVSRSLWLHALFAITVLWLSKPNTAWTAILLVVAASAICPRLFVSMIMAMLIGAMAASLILVANELDPVVVVRSYFQISGRPLGLFLVGILEDTNAILLMLTAMTYVVFAGASLACLRCCEQMGRRFLQPKNLVAVGGLAVSLVGFATNWDLKLNDIGPAILGVGLLVLAIEPSARNSQTRREFIFVVAMACVLGIVTGAERLRMQLSGPWAGPAFGELVSVSDPFFGRFEVRTMPANLLELADKAMLTRPDSRVFFGPRLEFMYARLGIPSPKHLPIWWHEGTSFPTSSMSKIIESWKAAQFETVILAKKDNQRFPEALLEYIHATYEQRSPNGVLDVYVKRGR